MKKNIFFKRLVTFAIATIMSLSAITMISVTVKAAPTVDGVITPGEYDGGLHIVMEGPWDSPSSPYDGPLDGYLYWDSQYFWIAVDEPVPEWIGGGSFIEFMWDAGVHGTLPYYHAWVLFSDGLWQYVRCGKPSGSWGWAADPFPGHSSWAVGTATEFKFDYTDYGTQPGDTIKLIVDSSDRSASSLTFGNCQIWPYVSPSNPDYYPSETPSSVATWGTIVLSTTGNQPPTADAGGPYSGLTGASISLDGSGSYDLDGTIVSYAWDLDHDGFYDDATGSTTTHSWPSEGTYTISLKVTDDDGASDTASTIVNIGNHVVDGIISPDEYDGGMAVALVAGAWTVDAFIDWDCHYMYVAVDEPVPGYIEFAFDAGLARSQWDLFGMFPGSSFYQKCNKPGGAWSTVAPIPVAFAFSAASSTATEFKFDYTAFGIVPGNTIKMCIERGASPNAFWPAGGIIWQNPPRTPDILTWGDVTLTGDCGPQNIPPIADANGPYSGGISECIHLDGTGSYDPDGTIICYAWDLDNDGVYDDATGPTPTHSWCTAGTYPISLKVTDDGGLTDIDDTTVTIRIPNIPPVADANGPYYGYPNNAIQFDGSGSYDPDGTIICYQWCFGDGVPGTGVKPTHTYTKCGVYPVTLVVTDNGGLTDTDQTTATILPTKLVVDKKVWNGTAWVDDIRVNNGTKLNFRIQITNNDCCPFTSLLITDYLSVPQLKYLYQSSLTPIYATDNEIRWQTDLNPLQTITIYYNASAIHTCYGWNSVYVKDDRGTIWGYDLSKIKVVSAGGPALAVSTTVWNEGTHTWDDHISLKKDKDLTFKITIDSTALSTIHDVILTDILPTLITYNYDASRIPTSASDTEITWSLGEIAPGEEIEIILTANTKELGTDHTIANVISTEGYTDEDYVLLEYDLAPDMMLLYPIGGETLKDTVAIQWFAHDIKDGSALPIYIYFKDTDDTLWTAFSENPYTNNGALSWDTTIIPDGTYQLQISTQDSNNNVVDIISNFFKIQNTEVPTENLAPTTPDRPSGSSEGKLKVEYTYSTRTIDPNEDQVYYLWDWDDGTTSGWLGPYNSGDIISVTHTWDSKGAYSIKVKAKDIYGTESDWSDPLPISMLYKYNGLLLFLEKLCERFPNLFPILRQLLGY